MDTVYGVSSATQRRRKRRKKMTNNIPMSPAEFKEEMLKISENGDIEVRHGDADTLMATVLRELGYQDGIDIYDDMEMWYA